jgi:ABC-type polysaccharide/polyol phosphate export permease
MDALLEVRARERWLEIVRELAVSDFRLKYNDSALGYAWSMLSPLTMLVIYYFVFRHIIGVRSPDYQVYLLVGVVYWTFFQDCTFSGLSALVSKAGVLKSIHVPVILVVAGGALSTVITIVINTAVLIVVLGVWGKLSPLFPLVLIPLACLVLLASATGMLVALAYVHFRDIGLIWHVVLQAWFWMTPVVYTVHSTAFEEILYVNPVARCLYLIRWFLVYDYLPAMRFLWITVVLCVSVFVLALRLFLGRQKLIPESL